MSDILKIELTIVLNEQEKYKCSIISIVQQTESAPFIIRIAKHFSFSFR